MRITTTKIILFMMFNILCISLQLCLISSVNVSKDEQLEYDDEDKRFDIYMNSLEFDDKPKKTPAPAPTPQIPLRCVVMPEEMDYCKECEPKKDNYTLFYTFASNHYCDIDYELQKEIIQCPFGWTEYMNYRTMKKYSEYSMRCTSQKVCCLYSTNY
jgi:hypothetical protein|tara:strand:+ start:211 stop:681 length:471 start_codon:yes stop_codon:yes gene_type:complete